MQPPIKNFRTDQPYFPWEKALKRANVTLLLDLDWLLIILFLEEDGKWFIAQKTKFTKYKKRMSQNLLNEAYVFADCFNYNFKSYRYRNYISSRTDTHILIIQQGRKQTLVLTIEPLYFFELRHRHIFSFSFTAWPASDSLASPI